jgi:putative ABC transport system substrate-binding protein
MEGVCSAQVQAQNKHSGGDKDAMKKNVFCLALGAMLFALCFSAEAQQLKKVPRIGYLSAVDPATDSARVEGIRLALRELGYIEGQNIAIEYRYGEGKRDRYPDLAAELVRLKVDIIVVGEGRRPIQAAKNATKTIPIIMVGTGLDPVEAGLVESLARPGGNVTGITNLTRELGGKRLELLKETVPKLARVAVLYDPTTPSLHEVKEGKEGQIFTFDIFVRVASPNSPSSSRRPIFLD